MAFQLLKSTALVFFLVGLETLNIPEHNADIT